MCSVFNCKINIFSGDSWLIMTFLIVYSCANQISWYFYQLHLLAEAMPPFWLPLSSPLLLEQMKLFIDLFSTNLLDQFHNLITTR